LLEIGLVLLLQRVDEGEVERPDELRQRLQRRRVDDPDAIAHARELPEAPGAVGPRLVRVDRHELAVGRHRARHPERGVADRGADLDDAARAGRAHEHREEAADRRADDRDLVATALAVQQAQHVGQVAVDPLEVIEVMLADAIHRVPHARSSSRRVVASTSGRCIDASEARLVRYFFPKASETRCRSAASATGTACTATRRPSTTSAPSRAESSRYQRPFVAFTDATYAAPSTTTTRPMTSSLTRRAAVRRPPGRSGRAGGSRARWRPPHQR